MASVKERLQQEVGHEELHALQEELQSLVDEVQGARQRGMLSQAEGNNAVSLTEVTWTEATDHLQDALNYTVETKNASASVIDYEG